MSGVQIQMLNITLGDQLLEGNYHSRKIAYVIVIRRVDMLVIPVRRIRPDVVGLNTNHEDHVSIG